MSEYGIKIRNFQAASIYEVNRGIRDKFDSTDAMLVNSLFLDFLLENGLNVWKGESTRDVICLEFGYGSPSYKKQIENYNKKLHDDPDNESLKFLIEKAQKNEEKYCEISRQDIRTLYYNEGVDINYRTFNKSGKLIKEELIHYKMLYRTPGKAKKGTCMFICDRLYDLAHEFLYMGIELPKEKSPIVEIGAYSSLITSSIVGYVQIRPEEMLIVKDLPTEMRTKVIAIKTDENKSCYAEEIDNYLVDGEAFDGQALIDSSIFPPWGDGYLLLRHHMTKCAAFCTHIQKFMQDKFGDQYETATVKDMWGRDVRVKDIKLITTNNAIKWLKFGKDFDYWCNWIAKNDYKFGVVKTAHPSKFGDVQRTSYQMTNALDINTMEGVVAKSVDYINKLKADNEVFLQYLRDNSNFSNDYEVLVALVEHNPEFVRSEYFRDRKKEIIRTYSLDFKGGRTLQNADNLTIVGSPYAMLLHSIGEDARDDPTFKLEDDCIQCWVSRFKDGEYLAEFRSPFNSRNNLGYLHNVYHEYFDKYFSLGRLCVAINTIDTDFQSRNNGSDQDSDSIYTTNQPDVVNHAKYCYSKYPSIVNEIKPEKNIYNLSMDSYAAIDNSLMAAQLAIGQSSNLAQLALSYTYNFDDRKYYDYTCILSVIAQCAIDNAKRKYDISLPNEIKRINNDLDIKTNGLPLFWQITKKDKRKARNDKERSERRKQNRKKIKDKLNSNLVCPMNYLFNIEFEDKKSNESTLPMSYFFINHIQDNDRRKSKKVEELIEKYSFELHNFQMDHSAVDLNYEEDSDDYILLRSDFDDLIKDIQSVYISKNYLGLMSWLINRAFYIGAGAKSKINIMNSKIDKNKSLLMKVLYSVNKDAFLKCFVEKTCTTIEK